ncbi:MAG: ECF-type sigma factor [Planctomycetota bacterium JB042]
MPPMSEVTTLLRRLDEGDRAAFHELVPLVYAELRRIADAQMARQAGDHTLQPTALVNEAFLKLAGPGDASFESKSHFLAAAARAMRTVLIDHARAKATAKRTGKREPLVLEGLPIPVSATPERLLALDEELGRLAELDEPLARIVELRFFGGLSVEEAAHVLEVSTQSIVRGWRTARAWLAARLP